MKKIKHILIILLCAVSLNAQDSTRSNLTFSMDDDANLNPTIFIPVYYGDENQFFSAVGYTSSNYKDNSAIDGFNDSKNALISSDKELSLNYINYETKLFGLVVSVGVKSTFSQIDNNEFGYIHDSDDIFGNGIDYYISFDNEIELDVQRHAIRADISLPIGDFFSSRLTTSISPFTSIGVKQSTIFKPLVNETGTSSSKTNQDISYNFLYELQMKTGTFVDIGAIVSYDNQPLKYDIAQLAKSGASYLFEINTVDTTEVRTLYMLKFIFDVEIMGGLNPSLGYGKEKLDIKNNLTNTSESSERNLLSFGIEKRF